MTTSARPPTPPATALPVPVDARWRPLRAGLQNLWQYDHTTRFVFHRGRLLLRGRNGSGKTKAVELLLPFLLEGRLDPRRLDPFGGQSRRMHYNLLHSGNADLQTSLGYAWLEFGRSTPEGPRYLTIGAGLKARRTSDQVDAWFFVLHDRRMDVDFALFDEARVPRSKSDLEEAMGGAGRVFGSARDYRAAVNRELFGLDAQQYEDLIEALLRLRQPHLSERLDPAQVASVLSDSLSPLDAERVREVAEGLERLEKHRRELAERQATLEAVRGFLGDYRTYVRAVAAARAAALTGADWRVRDASGKATAARTALAAAVERQAALATRRETVDAALASARVRIRTIETSDAYRAVQQLEEAEGHARAASARAGALDVRVRDADRRLDEAVKRHAAALARVAAQEASLATAATASARAAAAAGFGHAHVALVAQLAAGGEKGSGIMGARGVVSATLEARRRALDELRTLVRAVTAATQAEARETERLTAAEEARREAAGRVALAEQALAAATDAHRDAIDAWADALEVLALGATDRQRILDVPAEHAAAEASSVAAPARARLDAEVAAASLAAADLEAQTALVRAERTALAAVTHRPPPAPPWRTADRSSRPGAPFFLLIEFGEALDGPAQAGVEAALDAAGLLDAWVTPDGRVLDPGTFDVAALPPRGPSRPPHARTLADVTRPTPCGGVSAETIAAVASCVGVREAHADGAPTVEDAADAAWVAVDGRFRLGPLHGAALATTVAYVGERPRAEARSRRLEELDERLRALGVDGEAARGRLEACRARRRVVDAELARFPSPGPVLLARAALASASQGLERARVEVGQREASKAAATARRHEATRVRDDAALRLGLSEHVGALDALADATNAWSLASAEWIGAAEVLGERRAAAAEGTRARDAAEADAATLRSDAATAAEVRRGADERVKTLTEIVGSTGEDIRLELERTRTDEQRLGTEQARLTGDALTCATERGALERASEDAAAEHDRLEAVRERAAAEVRALVQVDVLRHVLPGTPEGEPEPTTLQATLAIARAVAKEGPAVPADDAGLATFLEHAQNTVGRRQHELQRALVAGVRLFGRHDRGVFVYDVQYLGKTHNLGGLVAELEDDAAEREARLAKDEQGLLESFLAGELHNHLRERIRDAAALVERMNRLLAECPTAAGQRLRLAWEVAGASAPGTAQAVDLLLRGSGLLTADHREQLRTWLHQRLRAAREGDAAASLHDRIAAAFDYRRWFAFSVEFRDQASPAWRRLTRLSHGAGSGGEKAVMLHLPLFAAMAAHYEGSDAGPRLIVLDEVFAGIDRGTRGQLMKLLVKLDLDALLTSHEEWGFYAELDGISTYHLIRDAELPGVLSEWFVWDGAMRHEMSGRPGAGDGA